MQQYCGFRVGMDGFRVVQSDEIKFSYLAAPGFQGVPRQYIVRFWELCSGYIQFGIFEISANGTGTLGIMTRIFEIYDPRFGSGNKVITI